MRAALLQMRTGIVPGPNAETLTGAIEDAAGEGAAMLFTPEMSGLLDQKRKRAAEHLRPEAEDTVLAAVCEAAAKHGLWVHLGSLALLAASGSERMVNRGFVIDDGGEIRARYDKIHLFDVDLDTGESWRESSVYDAGARAVVCETPLGKLGLSVCYDLRFPALYQALSDAGAELFAIPAAFTRPTGRAHWHVLLRARAIESAAFVLAAAQHGEHQDGRATYGHSLAVDPWGEILLDSGEGTGLGYAEIGLERLKEVRQRIPVLRHRRPIPPVEQA